MGVPQPKPKFEDFLDWERSQSEKHFYFHGEIFAMVGVRQAHAHVTGNLFAALKSTLRGSPCRVFVADMLVKVEAAEAAFYPDIVVSCDERDRTTPYHLAHPKLIVEVLSESTAAFDRGPKFAAFRQLPSLEEYVLIDIDARRVEAYRKNSAGRWELFEFCNAAPVTLASVGATLAAETVYEDVEAA